MPINFITGEHNHMFVPEGPAAHLRHAPHGATARSSTRHTVIEDYAHLDCWLGTNAERDVLPTALAELEKHN